MINRTEADERDYLKRIRQKLGEALSRLDDRVRRYAQEARAEKAYLWESRSDMDHAEKVSARQAALQTIRSGEAVLASRDRVEKLLRSPYFGRVDFRRDDAQEALPVYVGVHAFTDDAENRNLVFDWRAPVSTVFYDYELGPARYASPSGPVTGEVLLKRQFRVRDGEMQFMLESGLNILDDVLQEELSRASDDRMKTIVATIQRDQNAIIRNEDARTLIIQGVAGSGKTSIALHRIAFLLYRYKESLSSRDILIISPNKVFGDFISDVLPELGEEPIAEKEMEGLARELLDQKVAFQTAFEQAQLLLKRDDEAMRLRMREKSSLAFLKTLDAYVTHVEETRFTPADIWIAGRLVPEFVVQEAFTRRGDLPVAERLRFAGEILEQEIWTEYRYEITAKERAALKAALKKMYRNATLRATYKALFAWMGRPELFKAGSKLEYADVFPLIYLKMRLEGIDSPYKEIKHLVIDEMQDYTPVQYAVLARLFTCEKTILGDARQAVNPYTSSTADTIGAVFRQAECVALTKSYRSSFEITRFAQQISPSEDLVAIERHGEAPRVAACRSKGEETDLIRQTLRAFRTSGYRTLGIVCKTQPQAEKLHQELRDDAIQLLTSESTAFEQGAVVCCAHLAKGLEFDAVHVPGVTEKGYATKMDRNLLYVACTRAMHRLVLTHTGRGSRFLPTADDPIE